MHRRPLASAIGALALLLFLFAAPVQAAPTERVADGGFETTTCAPGGDNANCSNSNWTLDVTSMPRQGFFCAAGVSCNGSDAVAGAAWFQFGGKSIQANSTATGRVTQSVSIPAGPATLSFALRQGMKNVDTESLTVAIDGTQVGNFTKAGGAGPSGYVTQTIPVGASAGPGPHVLSFSYECRSGNAPNLCGTFDIDSVSLVADSDGDGDGVADAADECPSVAGTAANNGCPADSTPAAACDKAKAKLAKAKAKLAKLKDQDASKEKLKKAKEKVKKAKTAKKKACAS